MVKAKLYRQNHTKKHIYTHSQKRKRKKNYICVYKKKKKRRKRTIKSIKNLPMIINSK